MDGNTSGNTRILPAVFMATNLFPVIFTFGNTIGNTTVFSSVFTPVNTCGNTHGNICVLPVIFTTVNTGGNMPSNINVLPAIFTLINMDGNITGSIYVCITGNTYGRLYDRITTNAVRARLFTCCPAKSPLPFKSSDTVRVNLMSQKPYPVSSE